MESSVALTRIWNVDSELAYAPVLEFYCSYCKKVLFRCRGWDITRIFAEHVPKVCPYCGKELKEVDWEKK